MVPAMPIRAAKLFQLLDFCDGGAVLRNRRAGAAARGTARNAVGRAINRTAGRNMLKGDKGTAVWLEVSSRLWAASCQKLRA